MSGLLRRDPVARFFATGLLLATPPICSTAPHDRLLFFVSFGAVGLVAQFLASAATRGERIVAAFLFLIHVVIAPPLLAVKSATVGFGIPNEMIDRAIPTTADVASKTVLVVNPPSEGFGVALISSRLVRGIPHPVRLHTLAGVTTELTVTRVDERTLRLRPARGFLEHTMERGYRTPERPLLPGSVVNLTGISITVTEDTPDLRPAEALVHFDVSLEDQSLIWLRWDHGHFSTWVPPTIGTTVRLPAYGAPQIALDLQENLSGR